MHEFSVGKKGRKKAVREFRLKDGLWILILTAAAAAALLVLFLSGILRLDVD
jgi:hypothetical protein